MASRGHLTSRLGTVAVVSHHLELENHSILLKIHTISSYLSAVTDV